MLQTSAFKNLSALYFFISWWNLFKRDKPLILTELRRMFFLSIANLTLSVTVVRPLTHDTPAYSVSMFIYLLVLTAAFTRGGLSRHHQGMAMLHGQLARRGPQTLNLLALHLKPSLSGLWAPERPLFTHRGVLTIPPFIGPFCMSVGAQSTVESWHADPLTPFRILEIPLKNNGETKHVFGQTL